MVRTACALLLTGAAMFIGLGSAAVRADVRELSKRVAGDGELPGCTAKRR